MFLFQKIGCFLAIEDRVPFSEKGRKKNNAVVDLVAACLATELSPQAGKEFGSPLATKMEK